LKFKSFEEQDEAAFTLNIHYVCLMCKKKCKQPYSFWSDTMPPTEFCDKFEPIEEEESEE